MSSTTSGEATDAAVRHHLVPFAALPSDRFLHGVHDSEVRAFERAPLDVEQEFFSWEQADDLARFIAACRRKQRIPLAAIEPWTTASDNPAGVLAETVAGANDDLIREHARIIKASSPHPVIVRFAAAMDLVGYFP